MMFMLLTLEDGSVIDREVVRYKASETMGCFVYQLADLESHSVDLTDIRRIEFYPSRELALVDGADNIAQYPALK